ncbi:MAG: hypothetical protein MI922_27600 [Bacteroidales bacterium]|nr:hypothetical protein [Bacteroidales bacterium]
MMDKIDIYKYCKVCKNQSYNLSEGLICGITGEKPSFEEKCINFDLDKEAEKQITSKENLDISVFNNHLKSYISLIYSGLAITIFAFLLKQNVRIPLVIIGSIIIMSGNIISLVLHYRIWDKVIDELDKHNISSPVGTAGKAVGYLFIPFFNFYWLFISYRQLGRQINILANQRKSTTIANESHGLLYSIFLVCSVIPLLGIATSIIATFVILPFLYSNFIKVLKTTLDVNVNNATTQDSSFKKEPINFIDVRDFSQLFNKKRYGFNYQVVVLYFIANLIAGFIFSLVRVGIGFNNINMLSGVSRSFTSNIGSTLFILALVLLCYVIKNKWILAGLAGLVKPIISVLTWLIIYIRFNQNSFIEISDYLQVYSIVSGFIFGFILVILLLKSIELWGVRFWSIFLAFAIPGILAFISWIFWNNLTQEHAYQIKWTDSGTILYYVLSGLAFYLGLRLNYYERGSTIPSHRKYELGDNVVDDVL